LCGAIDNAGAAQQGTGHSRPVLTDMQRFPRSLLIGLCLGLTLGLQSATAQPATQ